MCVCVVLTSVEGAGYDLFGHGITKLPHHVPTANTSSVSHTRVSQSLHAHENHRLPSISTTPRPITPSTSLQHHDANPHHTRPTNHSFQPTLRGQQPVLALRGCMQRFFTMSAAESIPSHSRPDQPPRPRLAHNAPVLGLDPVLRRLRAHLHGVHRVLRRRRRLRHDAAGTPGARAPDRPAGAAAAPGESRRRAAAALPPRPRELGAAAPAARARGRPVRVLRFGVEHLRSCNAMSFMNWWILP